MEDKINAFATSCYRVMLNIKRVDRISNAAIYNMTKTIPLLTRVRTQQLKFLGLCFVFMMMNLWKNTHCMFHRMGSVGQEGYARCAWNMFRTSWKILLECCSQTIFLLWPKIAAVGEILWSPAPQPNDDDDESLKWNEYCFCIAVENTVHEYCNRWSCCSRKNWEVQHIHIYVPYKHTCAGGQANTSGFYFVKR